MQKVIIGTLLVVAIAIDHCIADSSVRTCFSCNGIACLRTSLNKTQQCMDPLDYCVTIFEKSEVKMKGCSLEVPEMWRKYCDMNHPECHKCYNDRCNNLGQINAVCIQCDSSKDKNCAKNPESIEPTRCATPTAPNSYCYVKVENNVTKRGCATTAEDQLQCSKDGNCMLCSPDVIRGCNKRM